MSSSNRKRFNNVSVGDGNFLVQLNSTRPPEVLVLSSRPSRDKCKVVARVKNGSCKFCCLQSEWMDSSGRRQRECFAECGARRVIDFELKVQANQPDGKLMILGLKQLLKSPTDEPLKCHTSTTWVYQKKSNSTVASSQTYYSSVFGTNQVPKLSIESLEMSWNPTDKRELISLQVEPLGRVSAHHQQVALGGETLVMVELFCYQPPGNSSRQPSNEPPVPATILHLLALIDRQQLNQRPTGRLDDATHKWDLHPTPRKLNNTITTSGQLVDATTTIGSTIMPIDTTTDKSQPVDTNTELASVKPFATTTVKSVLLSAAAPSLNWTQHRFHLLATELQLIRHQLTPNGLLFLVLLCLALLILIYTLCLCLKPAGKSTIKRSSEKRKRKRKHQQPAVSMRISKPFNLQMPPATQTRLHAMMGLGARFPVPTAGGGTGRERLVPSSGGGWRILGAVPHPAVAVAVVAAAKANRCQTKQQMLAAQRQMKQQASIRVGLKRHRPNQLPELSRRTIRMVRNLRSAASLARSRLKQTHSYQSNLHAIPELESEHQHQNLSMASLIEIKAQAHQQHEHPKQATPKGFLEDPSDKHQLDSVVYDALSNECSHFVERFNVISQTEANATLFSKPDKSTCTQLTTATTTQSSDSKAAVQVSRSRILNQVKLHVKKPDT